MWVAASIGGMLCMCWPQNCKAQAPAKCGMHAKAWEDFCVLTQSDYSLCHACLLRVCRHEYPQWRPQDLSRVFPSLEESGLELMRAMLQYDPARRISVSIQQDLASRPPWLKQLPINRLRPCDLPGYV